MNDIHPREEIQGVENLDGKDSNKRLMQTFVVVRMDQFIQVRVQQLEDNALNNSVGTM